MVDKNLKKKQFAVYDSDTPVTLKQGQGHQTWLELVDSKQDFINAKMSKSEKRSKIYIRLNITHSLSHTSQVAGRT